MLGMFFKLYFKRIELLSRDCCMYGRMVREQTTTVMDSRKSVFLPSCAFIFLPCQTAAVKLHPTFVF